MPLPATEKTYQAAQVASTEDDQDPSIPEEYDQFTSPTWAFNYPTTTDLLDMVLPSDEAILEAITCTERPWAYFILEIEKLEVVDKGFLKPGYF